MRTRGKSPLATSSVLSEADGLNVVFLNVFGAVVLCAQCDEIYVLRSAISARCGFVVRAPSKFILLYHRLGYSYARTIIQKEQP